jgi:hypothetical protein
LTVRSIDGIIGAMNHAIRASGSAYFGPAWPSGICETGHQVPTPTGVPCLECLEAIAPGDRGSFIGSEHGPAPIHAECQLRAVIGGIEHLTAGPHPVGSCYEGSALTRRASALAAWEWVAEHGFPWDWEAAHESPVVATR